MTPERIAELRRYASTMSEPQIEPAELLDLLSLAEQSARMRVALDDAIELAAEGWGYADDYFRDKWGYAKRIAELRAALSPAKEEA